MDIMLPGKMDGIETATYLNKLNIPVIYSSAYTEDNIIKRAKKTNPLGYIVKPIRFENAKIAIEMALYKNKMRKRLNKEIIERQHAFSELQKLNEELQHFTFGASHDLQEPLRTIMCFSQLIQEKHASKTYQDIPELTKFIIDAAGRMQDLIDSLLIYSGLSFKEKPFEWVNSKLIIDSAISNLMITVQETNVNFHIDNALPEIFGDKTQLIVLFQNLFSNAIKYCTEDSPSIHVSSENFEDHWCFAIKDNGIGIDTKYQDYIFKLFKRLHQTGTYKGSGLGLVICKKIVSRHGGEIWFESQPGKGTTFYFTISKKVEGS